MPWEAPTGVHPIVWLILLLLVGPPALLSTYAGKLPGVLGAASRWWRRRDRGADDSHAYRVSQAEIGRLAADYQRIREDYDSLVERMGRIEAELTEAETRFWAAIGYIRRLVDSHQRHVPDADIPTPPKELDGII